MAAAILFSNKVLKPLAMCTALLITILTYQFLANSDTEVLLKSLPSESEIHCFRYGIDELPKNHKQKILPDFSFLKIRENKSIFFHETSCRSWEEEELIISPRQACAVESAARADPNLDIYMTFSASAAVISNGNTENGKIIKVLQSYSNVVLAHLNYESYLRDTDLEEIYRSGRLESSPYAVSHASDILRYLSLAKYGGYYLDLDVIVLKSLQNLPYDNFAGAESQINMAAGVIKFSKTSEENSYGRKCVRDLRENYDPKAWGNNGPKVITRLLDSLCGTSNVSEMIRLGECDGFKVFPEKSFYPVSWQNWFMYFDPEAKQEVIGKANDSIVIHVWNKHSEKTQLDIDKDGNLESAYGYFAKQYCPLVYAQCKDYF